MNETPKHTPGPWKLEKLHPGGDYIVYKAMNLPVAKVLHPEDSALIAAAPEMLAALKRMMHYAFYKPGYNTWQIEISVSFFEHNKELIAKAEGRQE
jgi:hypothetical protein